MVKTRPFHFIFINMLSQSHFLYNSPLIVQSIWPFRPFMEKMDGITTVFNLQKKEIHFFWSKFFLLFQCISFHFTFFREFNQAMTTFGQHMNLKVKFCMVQATCAKCDSNVPSFRGALAHNSFQTNMVLASDRRW